MVDIRSLNIPTPKVFADYRGGTVLCAEAYAPMETKLAEWMGVLSACYEASTGYTVDLTKLPLPKQRQLATLAENVKTFTTELCRRKEMGLMGRGSQMAKLSEAVTTADIAPFITQQLAYVVDVFAPWIIDQIVTTRPMTGPYAMVHRQTYLRSDACGPYDAESPLVDGLDPSCSDCPTECEASNGIDVEITSETITAECQRLSGKYCLPANWHFSSQYGGDLGRVLMDGMTIEHRRAIQAKILIMMLANAINTFTWNATPAAGSYWETANPNEWKAELWNTVKAANRDSLGQVDGRRSLDLLLGDISSIGYLEDAVPMQLMDEQPGNPSFGRGDELSSKFAITKNGRFQVFRFLEGMPENTMMLTNRDDRDPTVVHAPWIPTFGIEALTDPETAQTKLGVISLQGRTVLRPGRIEAILIGP